MGRDREGAMVKVYRCPVKRSEQTTLPCESCGRSVVVTLPFTGCVYCSDCMRGGVWEASSEGFHKRIRKETTR